MTLADENDSRFSFTLTVIVNTKPVSTRDIKEDLRLSGEEIEELIDNLVTIIEERVIAIDEQFGKLECNAEKILAGKGPSFKGQP